MVKNRVDSKIKKDMNKKHLIVLIFIALLLFVGMLFSLFKSAFDNPAGRILNSTDYGYQGVNFTDSIYIFTGSDLLLSGSGKILSKEEPIVTEIKYSSGAAIMHRKLAITSGRIVTTQPDFFQIYLASGATVYDALTDDGDTGLFKEIKKQGTIKIRSGDELIESGEGEWNYVDADEKMVEVILTEKIKEGDFIQRKILLPSEEINFNDLDEIEVVLSTGAEITEVEMIEIPAEEIEQKDSFENDNSAPPVENESAHAEENLTTSSSGSSGGSDSANTSDNPLREENEPNQGSSSSSSGSSSGGMYWDQYPNTDEGNYDLATDKLNANYCNRINDSILRLTCQETIYEALGQCDFLQDLSKNEACQNARIKSTAVASDRLSKCAEIKNDDNLKNTCINEINQNLYDAALKAGDGNICKAIYNASLVNQCLTEIGAE